MVIPQANTIDLVLPQKQRQNFLLQKSRKEINPKRRSPTTVFIQGVKQGSDCPTLQLSGRTLGPAAMPCDTLKSNTLLRAFCTHRAAAQLYCAGMFVRGQPQTCPNIVMVQLKKINKKNHQQAEEIVKLRNRAAAFPWQGGDCLGATTVAYK